MSISGSAAHGTITTGGFSYDQSTLEGLVKEWLALAFDYDRSLRRAQDLTMVTGPGLDFASKAVAGAAVSYGRAYLEYLERNRDYCMNQAQLCQNALDDYLGVERRNVTEVGQATRGDDESDQGI